MAMPPPSPPSNFGRSPLGPWSGHQPPFRKPAPGKENVPPIRSGAATSTNFPFRAPTPMATPRRASRARRSENSTPNRSRLFAPYSTPPRRRPESFGFSLGRREEESEEGEIRDEQSVLTTTIRTSNPPRTSAEREVDEEIMSDSEQSDPDTWLAVFD